ncbi:leucine-rich_repeat domain-containing protein [Hexamita inflata]|uniref:Leucine-rich repeat domain-containing protein n=1 Tax=Hexamita inflata TaxID=28002 RepID=A0AA86QF02_9EUKA|nr:leucine-rich repeat domain-containing protein [Hexamita inflata]
MSQLYTPRVENKKLEIRNNDYLTNISFINYIDIDYLKIEKCSNVLIELNTKKIIELHIIECELNTTLGIHEFINLQVLVLSRNRITQLNGLELSSHLQKLDFSYNSLTDISSLSHLKQLQYLDLTGCDANLCPIEGLTELTYLSLSQTKLENTSLLSKLTKLQELYLFYNSLMSLSGLQNMQDLRKLDVASNILKDISVLKLLSLTELNISQNYNIDLHSLLFMKSLKKLSIFNTRLHGEVLVNLKNLVNLEELYLSNIDPIDNILLDIYHLKSLKKLKKLDLYMNNVIDITALQDLNNLQELNLEYNKIQSFDAIKNHENYVKYKLQKQQIPTSQELFFQYSISAFYYQSDLFKKLVRQNSIMNQNTTNTQKAICQILSNSIDRHNIFTKMVGQLFSQYNYMYENDNLQ